jgi:hypothetical protein
MARDRAGADFHFAPQNATMLQCKFPMMAKD